MRLFRELSMLALLSMTLEEPVIVLSFINSPTGSPLAGRTLPPNYLPPNMAATNFR